MIIFKLKVASLNQKANSFFDNLNMYKLNIKNHQPKTNLAN